MLVPVNLTEESPGPRTLRAFGMGHEIDNGNFHTLPPCEPSGCVDENRWNHILTMETIKQFSINGV